MDRDVIFEGGWYVLFVAPRDELKVVAQVEKLGGEAYSPMETIWRKTARKKEPVPRALLPRYVFVLLSRKGLQFHDVRELKGVECLVGVAGKPARMPDITVRRLRADEAEGLFNRCKGYVPKRGDSVLITDGAFAGRVGRVEKARAGAKQIKVLLDKFMGARMKIDIPVAMVEEAA